MTLAGLASNRGAGQLRRHAQLALSAFANAARNSALEVVITPP